MSRWLQRLFRQETEIPPRLWADTVLALPFLQRLSADELARLKHQAETLLASKSLSGAAGLEISDEMAASIAAQACLPILHLGLELYQDMTGIVVYPSAFLVHRQEQDDAGVVHEWQEPLSGEAMDAGGGVVLSWEDIQPSHFPDAAHVPAAAHNVVIHEFVHKIDMLHDGANGCPPFLPKWHAGIDPARWQQVFRSAFEDLQDRVARPAPPRRWTIRFPDEPESPPAPASFAGPPLDPYAATHPAEFFAVAAETFFMAPQDLHQAYPEVYALLAAYFRQAPLGPTSERFA